MQIHELTKNDLFEFTEASQASDEIQPAIYFKRVYRFLGIVGRDECHDMNLKGLFCKYTDEKCLMYCVGTMNVVKVDSNEN